MILSTRHRGILLLSLGLFFTVTFLVGGGVVTSTNGGYWTTVFILGFVLGLACAGPFVYRSAKATGGKSTDRIPMAAYLVGPVVIGLTFPIWLALFRSDLFSSNLVQHTFMVCMGLGLAQFVPLGLGFLRAHAEQSHALEPAAGPVSNGKSSPPA
jgi:hypothetical protein